jgi:tetratricopeptide (TPR) repeat protein
MERGTHKIEQQSEIDLGREALRLWRAGQKLEALEFYGRAIDQSPEDSVLLLNRAHLLVELGNVSEALSDFKRARAGQPHLPDELFELEEGIQSMSPAALELFVQKRKQGK